MHQRGKTVTSGGQTSSDRGSSALGRQHQIQLHSDCPRFNDWIDPSSDATDTEVSNLVNGTTTTIINHQKRCCRTSTSSGYSSHSPPLSAGSYSSACCPTSGVLRGTVAASATTAAPHHHHHHHHHHHPTISRSGVQRDVGIPVLAVIHEAETIPRPIWPCMADDLRDIHTSPESAPRCGMLDCDVAAAHAAAGLDNSKHDALYACCGYCCVCSAYAYRNSSGKTSANSAREVLLELSRTLNSVIEADSDLSAEEILRDISITVARGIQGSPKDPPFSGICEDYTYRLSSSSSSGGKESVGVNPVNLRVYSKPKWLHVPASSRSSSQCPYEGKTLLTAAQNASRTPPVFGDVARNDPQRKGTDIAPAIFLVPQVNCMFPGSLNGYRSNNLKVAECKDGGKKDVGTGRFDGSKRNQPIGRLNAGTGKSCDDKCNSGEPVYSTLDGSDESSSYGAIGESTAKTEWNEGSKVFDRHLDFTLDGNRAERLGRVIAKAKRKRQWCRGLTAMFGLVFFVLSVVVVSLSVTRGRKVFGSM